MTILSLKLGTEGTLDYYFVYKNSFLATHGIRLHNHYSSLFYLEIYKYGFCIMIARDGKDGYTSIF